MDRSAFLESLSFLVPTSPRGGRRRDGGAHTDHRWPVPKLAEREQRAQYRITEEVLVPRHCLSIEPLLMEGPAGSASSSQTSGAPDDSHTATLGVGVAFFDVDRAETCADQRRKQSGSDPALAPCDLELCVYQKLFPPAHASKRDDASRRRHRAHFSPSSARTSGPVAAGASILRNQSGLDTSSSFLAALSMKVDGLVFYVNWTRLIYVQVEEPNAEQEQSHTKPPCLLLCFPGCLLRIFALGGESQQEPSNQSSGHSTSLLSAGAGRYHALKDALDQLLAKAHRSQTFTSPESYLIAVPILSSGSIIGSSSASSSPSTRTVNDCGDGEKRPESAERESTNAFKHRQRAHQQCLDEIASLWTLLQLGISSTAARSVIANRSDSAASIGSVLTTVALDLATSYGDLVPAASIGGLSRNKSAASSTSHREGLEQRLKQTQEQIDEVLDEFFPAPRPRQRPPTKRPRTVEFAESARDAAFAPSTVTAPQDTTTYAEQAELDDSKITGESFSIGIELRLQALVHEHKRLTRERHDTFELPTR
jgi:hypothetical protein